VPLLKKLQAKVDAVAADFAVPAILQNSTFDAPNFQQKARSASGL
jgi:hypothetical protein